MCCQREGYVHAYLSCYKKVPAVMEGGGLKTDVAKVLHAKIEYVGRVVQ